MVKSQISSWYLEQQHKVGTVFWTSIATSRIFPVHVEPIKSIGTKRHQQHVKVLNFIHALSETICIPSKSHSTINEFFSVHLSQSHIWIFLRAFFPSTNGNWYFQIWLFFLQANDFTVLTCNQIFKLNHNMEEMF